MAERIRILVWSFHQGELQKFQGSGGWGCIKDLGNGEGVPSPADGERASLLERGQQGACRWQRVMDFLSSVAGRLSFSPSVYSDAKERVPIYPGFVRSARRRKEQESWWAWDHLIKVGVREAPRRAETEYTMCNVLVKRAQVNVFPKCRGGRRRNLHSGD